MNGRRGERRRHHSTTVSQLWLMLPVTLKMVSRKLFVYIDPYCERSFKFEYTIQNTIAAYKQFYQGKLSQV